MISRILKILVPAIGIVVLITAGMRSVQNGYRLKQWNSSGDLLSSIEVTEDSLLVFTSVDESDFFTPPIPENGDSILTMNGSRATFMTMVRETNMNPVGYEIEIVYRNSAGDTLRTMAFTAPVPRTLFVFVVILFTLKALIGIGFLLTGFWAFVKQPDSGAVRALALFCFSMSALLMTIFRFGYEHIPVMPIPMMGYMLYSMSIVVAFTGAFWFNLQLLFPTPRAFASRHPIFTHLLIYGPVAALIALNFLLEIRILEYALAYLILAQILAGFVFLFVRSARTKDLLEKRQTRLVLWGTGTGIFGFFFVILLLVLFRSWFATLSTSMLMGIFVLVFLGLLLSPLSFIYAFGKYRLLEVEGRIKRGTRRLTITAVLLVLFFAILYSLSGLILDKIGTQSKALVPALALVLAVGFTPAQKKAQGILERRIYPERTQLRNMLSDFLSNALAVSDRDTFWSELESRLCGVLKVDSVMTVLNSGESAPMVLRHGEETPFMPEGEFAATLLRFENRPLMVDEILASGAIHFTPQEREWLEAHSTALALPLASRHRMIGFLAVGMKRTRQDFEAADVEVLRSLSFQIAVAGENLRLLEENIEKQRMENELSMARKVQEGLLPVTMPETPGLEVVGTLLSCHEMAGDYFDVIRLDDNRTVLAIGDVTGHGAGPAMLMSNLQASIRTAVRIGSDLKQMIEQINDLIFENTQANQFITFFAGIYDAEASEFSYVNAGHNPPLLVKKDGSFSGLESGGLILGVVADITYEQESVTLEAGDLLFLYTDGLSESKNREGEMFEEERVEAFAVRNRDLPVGEMVERLASEVEGFTNGVEREDDLTLLIARVKG